MAVIDFMAAAFYGNKFCSGSILHKTFDGGCFYESIMERLKHQNGNCDFHTVPFLRDLTAGTKGLVCPAIAGTAVLEKGRGFFFVLVIRKTFPAGGTAFFPFFTREESMLSWGVGFGSSNPDHDKAQRFCKKSRDGPHRDCKHGGSQDCLLKGIRVSLQVKRANAASHRMGVKIQGKIAAVWLDYR